MCVFSLIHATVRLSPILLHKFFSGTAAQVLAQTGMYMHIVDLLPLPHRFTYSTSVVTAPGVFIYAYEL